MVERGEVPPGCELGPARVAEAAALGRLHVAIWRQAYAGLMRREHLDALDQVAFADRWRRIAERADADGWEDGVRGGVRTLVARVAGEPVGMITVGPARDDDAPAPTQLWALNVAAAWHGRGIAPSLVAAALPKGPAYLWVLRGNARAVAFYRRWGFELDGTTKDDPGYAVVDLRMTRA